MITVFVNGIDISQIDGVMITDRHIQAVPNIDVSSLDLSRAHGAKRTYKRYGTRKFNILGHIIQPNRTLAEAARNTLLSTLMNADETLVITDYNGVQRKINAECTNPIINEFNGGYCSFDLGFTAYDPFIYDQTPTTGISVSSVTTSPRIDQFGITCSAPIAPTITVTVNSLTATGVQELSVVDDPTGLGLTVSREWAAADVLVVDALNGTCKVNGTDVQYFGTFPVFKPGTRKLRVYDTFTARNINISLTYYARYF